MSLLLTGRLRNGPLGHGEYGASLQVTEIDSSCNKVGYSIYARLEDGSVVLLRQYTTYNQWNTSNYGTTYCFGIVIIEIWYNDAVLDDSHYVDMGYTADYVYYSA